MDIRRDRKHIALRDAPYTEKYKPHPRGGDDREPIPAPDRAAHGAYLKRSLESAVEEAKRRSQQVGFQIEGAVPSIYVQFESRPGVDLQTTSLEARNRGIELVAVKELVPADGGNPLQLATVVVPLGKVKHFFSRFAEYATSESNQKGEGRHQKMLAPISTLRLATLKALWTDEPASYPEEGETCWWEVWLRKHDGKEVERLSAFAQRVGMRLGARRLAFEDRIVVLACGNPEQLSASIDVLHDMAEVRRAKDTATFWVDQSPSEQAAWVDDLVRRTSPPGSDSPAVCILDTGVNHGHPLIGPALEPADLHSVEPSWGSHDDHGHGTEMAGLALYGNLVPALASRHTASLRHRLESVKILPPGSAANDPALYGAIIADATARVEIQAPRRRRCFSMAIATTDTRDRGQPTSWSAAIDALAAGRSFDPASQGLVYFPKEPSVPSRLFIIAAGNVSEPAPDHMARSESEPVHDPGQAWNALTVGACTSLALVQDPGWAGWRALARPGDLSPWSTTSVVFASEWPAKPDVVMEGGNVVVNGQDEIDHPVPELSLLSTHFRPTSKPLVLTWGTSAACAQVARMCGAISAEYPAFWPETVRALVVHSAQWTPQMRQYVKPSAGKREVARQLLRRFGHGIPDLERSLRSASNALTIVAQAEIRPFEQGALREMHLYELPWPSQILQDLGAVPVRLRVTLSYFVEPNPARRGWKHRFRYQSHGLRFQVKRPTESTDEFRKRINKRALDEDEEKPAATLDHGWVLGEAAQTRGSLHSDTWEGPAAELAERGVIGVFPVSGWWKDLPRSDRSEHGVRYSLVMSIEASEVDVDIWTPVANEVGILTPIDT